MSGAPNEKQSESLSADLVYKTASFLVSCSQMVCASVKFHLSEKIG